MRNPKWAAIHSIAPPPLGTRCSHHLANVLFEEPVSAPHTATIPFQPAARDATHVHVAERRRRGATSRGSVHLKGAFHGKAESLLGWTNLQL